MKSELQQLITELENEIKNYDQNRRRAQHVSRLNKIARNMQKELDRMPEFDIIYPSHSRDRAKHKLDLIDEIQCDTDPTNPTTELRHEAH